MELKVGTAEKENYEEKTLVTLVLDDSGSMVGYPSEQLNNALRSFQDDIKSNIRLSSGLEIAIVKFGTDVQTAQTPALINNVTMPHLSGSSGLTSLNKAVKEAIDITQERKHYYKETGVSYKRPWIILLTDGAPTDGDVSNIASIIEKDTKNKRYVFLPIGVDGADMNTLDKISGYTQIDGNFVKMNALGMDSAKFSEFFQWLSDSIQLLHNSKDGDSVQLPHITWTKGFVAG